MNKNDITLTFSYTTWHVTMPPTTKTFSKSAMEKTIRDSIVSAVKKGQFNEYDYEPPVSISNIPFFDDAIWRNEPNVKVVFNKNCKFKADVHRNSPTNLDDPDLNYTEISCDGTINVAVTWR